MRNKSTTYVGIHDDINGGMTSIGKIIRDAWVFGIIDESETCKGWNLGGLDALSDKVDKEWDKYGCLVSALPEDLFKRHQEIHNRAIAAANNAGWNGDEEVKDES